MEPFDITWPGSRDRITVSSIAREYELIDSAAEFLASRLGEYWSPKRHVAGGPFLSVDQRGAWRARIGDAFIAGCVVLVARHTSSNDGVVAVAIAERVPDLATAIRRHRGTRDIVVVGEGLAARDRDAVRGFPLRFDAARPICVIVPQHPLHIPPRLRVRRHPAVARHGAACGALDREAAIGWHRFTNRRQRRCCLIRGGREMPIST